MIWKEISCMSCVEYHHHLISSHLFHEATMTNKQPCSRKGLEHTSYNSVNSGSSVLGCGLLNPLPIFPLESVGSPSRAPPASLGLTFRYVQSLGKAARNNQFIWSCDLSITGGTIHVREIDNGLTQSRLLLFLSKVLDVSLDWHPEC